MLVPLSAHLLDLRKVVQLVLKWWALRLVP
jgi:hypothetical protein